MKRIFTLIAIFCTIKIGAQPYLISFEGTGESTTVNSVLVENLTAGTFQTLDGDNILRLNLTTGIHSTENSSSAEINIFPNPMTEKSSLMISPPSSGEAIISVFDITGKLIIQHSSYLENNTQEFVLSGLNKGIYLVNVKSSTYQLSGKVLSSGNSEGPAKLEKVIGTLTVKNKISEMNSKGDQVTVDMEYTTGDILKFTGESGDYSTVLIDIPTGDKTIAFSFVSCSDGDGNNYPVIEIGSGKSGPQVWMASNLKTTSYSDGTSIPLVNNQPDWYDLDETNKAYCWYDDDISNKDIYGALYTWAAAMNGASSSDTEPSGIQGVCPTGWHLPSHTEWMTLSTNLGGQTVAGGKLKEAGITHWANPNRAGNESGFTALPGGNRDHGGSFYSIRFYGYWWSSTADPGLSACYHFVTYNLYNEFTGGGYRRIGVSVRCVKD